MTDPTPRELEGRLDRELASISSLITTGFARVDRKLEQMQMVHPDVFTADQARQDEAILSIRKEFGTLAVHVEQETSRVRQQFVGGLLIVLVVAVLAPALTSAWA